MNDFFPGEGRKKITSLFSTEKRYNRSGSITTATIDKEDNIRQYAIINLDHVSWTSPTIRNKLSMDVWTLLLFSKLSKSNASPFKSNLWGSDWQIHNARSSTIKTIRFKSGNLMSVALSLKTKGVSTRKKLHTWVCAWSKLKCRLLTLSKKL